MSPPEGSRLESSTGIYNLLVTHYDLSPLPWPVAKNSGVLLWGYFYSCFNPSVLNHNGGGQLLEGQEREVKAWICKSRVGFHGRPLVNERK